MISLDLWRSRIGGWRGYAKPQFLLPHYIKSNLRMFCLSWRKTTCLSALTIRVLQLIGEIELNPEPGSTSGEEISPMEIEDSIHDTFDFSSETTVSEQKYLHTKKPAYHELCHLFTE